ncbi:hypothetical protein [Legionella tucsonensis]|uniref:Uncharacterized protein n=1 Tax=Legionella tucsonensis TaxID=40335 RepID=A0A0W0ZZ81_9GAMM|nr:hypothetical protein [Legionella tucsonensis]KTD74115.1 hypothetical protein Ltuc_1962 [Legionella tucsonensis]
MPKKVKGPKDGKIVTASFDPANKKDNSKSRFPSLKTTKDLVLLSIKGNEFCAGDYLGAIVQQAVATHQTPIDYSGPKGKTTFLIADEIYWHNLRDKTFSPGEEATLNKLALEEGESYFENNLAAFLVPLGTTVSEFHELYPGVSMDKKISIINQLALQQGKNFEIVRWHTWITQRDFDKTLKDILPHYDNVEGLSVAVDASADDYVKRHCKEEGDRGVWAERSRSYIKEESPSIMLLAAQLGYNFIIYPGAILPSFTATREYFIVNNHVARIEKGHSIKDECTHSKFCFHTENPSRLVNWLEVNFTRSHEAAKIQEATKPQKVTKSNEVTKSKAINFFQQNRSNLACLRRQTAEVVDEDGEVLQLVPAIVYPIIRGMSHALESQFSTQKDKSEKRIQTPLTQVFEGITRGVLSADLSMSDKIGFLTGLVNAYVDRSEPKYDVSSMPTHS